MKKLFALICLAVLAAGCGPKTPTASAPETKSQREDRWREEIPLIIAKECTNELVGFSRIIRSSIRDIGEPTNWTAEVTAEYVNHFGGIDRTNLPFQFCVTTNITDTELLFFGHVDSVLMFQRRMKALDEELKDRYGSK